MSKVGYTVGELLKLLEMSKQYFYTLVKQGKGPVMSGDGPRPVIALSDALTFAEVRAASVGASFRARWESGIRKIKLDMLIAKNAQAMQAAIERRKNSKRKKARRDVVNLPSTFMQVGLRLE